MEVKVPAEHDFPELSVTRSPHMAKLWRFLQECFRPLARGD